MDVVVVGGGPAGSATALACAGAGLRVVLLEARRFPRDRPGETLHPGVEPLLEQLGVAADVNAAGFPRFDGYWSLQSSSRTFSSFAGNGAGPWMGYLALRSEFDRLLLNGVVRMGAVVLQPCLAQEPLMDGARVAGVRHASGEVRGRLVVDATGSGHWLARHLGVARWPASRPLLARYGHLEGSCPEVDHAPTFAVDATGWTWTARVGNGLYQWTRLSPAASTAEELGPPQALSHLVARRPARGRDVTWRIAAVPAGRGYILVGDAGAVLDPASSHGVLRALMTGMMAARAACLISNGADEQPVLDAYCAWISGWFWGDVAELRARYGALSLSEA